MYFNPPLAAGQRELTDMDEDFVIGVDLGGTRLRAALMDDDLTIRAREETLTQADDGFEASLERMKA